MEIYTTARAKYRLAATCQEISRSSVKVAIHQPCVLYLQPLPVSQHRWIRPTIHLDLRRRDQRDLWDRYKQTSLLFAGDGTPLSGNVTTTSLSFTISTRTGTGQRLPSLYSTGAHKNWRTQTNSYELRIVAFPSSTMTSYRGGWTCFPPSNAERGGK